MKKIELTQNKYALVDDKDFEYLNQWKWCSKKNRNTFYAIKVNYNKKTKKVGNILMHRLIMNFPNKKQAIKIRNKASIKYFKKFNNI